MKCITEHHTTPESLWHGKAFCKSNGNYLGGTLQSAKVALKYSKSLTTPLSQLSTPKGNGSCFGSYFWFLPQTAVASTCALKQTEKLQLSILSLWVMVPCMHSLRLPNWPQQRNFYFTFLLVHIVTFSIQLMEIGHNTETLPYQYMPLDPHNIPIHSS